MLFGIVVLKWVCVSIKQQMVGTRLATFFLTSVPPKKLKERRFSSIKMKRGIDPLPIKLVSFNKTKCKMLLKYDFL